MEQLISCTTATINCKAVRIYVVAEKKVVLTRIFLQKEKEVVKQTQQDPPPIGYLPLLDACCSNFVGHTKVDQTLPNV